MLLVLTKKRELYNNAKMYKKRTKSAKVQVHTEVLPCKRTVGLSYATWENATKIYSNTKNKRTKMRSHTKPEESNKVKEQINT